MRARDKAERSEEALREGEERYRELVENANDIVFMLDLQGNVTSINKAVESITGYSQTELLGMNMSEFLTPASTESARLMTERKLAGEERTNYEVDVQTKDGHLLTLEISSRLARIRGTRGNSGGHAIHHPRHAGGGSAPGQINARCRSMNACGKSAGLAPDVGNCSGSLAIFRGLEESPLSVPERDLVRFTTLSDVPHRGKEGPKARRSMFEVAADAGTNRPKSCHPHIKSSYNDYIPRPSAIRQCWRD